MAVPGEASRVRVRVREGKVEGKEREKVDRKEKNDEIKINYYFVDSYFRFLDKRPPFTNSLLCEGCQGKIMYGE